MLDMSSRAIDSQNWRPCSPLSSPPVPLILSMSPWVVTSRGSSSSRRSGLNSDRRKRMSKCEPLSSLFDDLDPESSPLMKNLERKSKCGERMTEEDFLDPFPVFKRKIEKEFDEITEQFRRLSIENPESEDPELFSDEERVDHKRTIITKTITNKGVSDDDEAKEMEIRNSEHKLKKLKDFRNYLITKTLFLLTVESINILV